jgi:hypothetical protein
MKQKHNFIFSILVIFAVPLSRPLSQQHPEVSLRRAGYWLLSVVLYKVASSGGRSQRGDIARRQCVRSVVDFSVV